MFGFFEKKAEAPAKRPSWTRTKIASAIMRLFNAAKTETFWSAWNKSAATIDQAIHSDWLTLVARSREQYANNDYVKRYVELCQTNIVGETGITVQSTVVDRQGAQDVAVQRLIEQAWADFSRKVDMAGQLDRAEFEENVIQSCAIDGEAFIQIRVSKAAKWGVEFGLIDPVLIPVTLHDKDRNIAHGIEYNEQGRPVAYYFDESMRYKTEAVSGYVGNLDRLKRIPANQIMHVYVKQWVGQKRGLPWIATSLGGLKDLGAYIHAAIVNARVGATKMGFFETTGNGEYIGDEDAMGNMIMEADPGSFEVLPEGLKLSQWNPDYPHNQFGEFVTSQLRGIAAGLGVSHHALTGDMSGVNYSSARIASLDERDGWKRKQRWLINNVTRPMFELFINYAVDFGRISFNGSPLRNPAEFYHQATYQGRRWQWVDPQKELAAAQMAIDLQIKSKSDLIRETGKDPEDVWREIARESATIDSLGIKADNSENLPQREADEDADS